MNEFKTNPEYELEVRVRLKQRVAPVQDAPPSFMTGVEAKCFEGVLDTLGRTKEYHKVSETTTWERIYHRKADVDATIREVFTEEAFENNKSKRGAFQRKSTEKKVFTKSVLLPSTCIHSSFCLL